MLENTLINNKNNNYTRTDSPRPISNGVNKQSGQLLLEILIAVVAIVAIAGLGAQLVLVGQKSNEITGDKDTALKLVEETFEAVRSIATENWQTVYAPVSGKGSGNLYHPEQQSGKWVLVAGTQPVTINGVNYTRSLYIENVNRDASKNIVLTGGTDDPSTQKITVSISWPRGETITGSEYVTRWRGKGCVQTGWATQSSDTSPCPADTYYTKDDSINTSGGELKLQ